MAFLVWIFKVTGVYKRAPKTGRGGQRLGKQGHNQISQLTEGFNCLPSLCITREPGREQTSKSEVQLLLNVYHCFTILQLKNPKLNHRK